MVDSTNLIHGTDVYTSDGDKIGQVGEIHGTFFKVDAAMMPDYWLRTECVLSSGGTGVRLSFSKDELGDYKVDTPDTTTDDR
jgi:hypothetical protein